jgi:hypothetical protein
VRPMHGAHTPHANSPCSNVAWRPAHPLPLPPERSHLLHHAQRRNLPVVVKGGLRAPPCPLQGRFLCGTETFAGVVALSQVPASCIRGMGASTVTRVARQCGVVEIVVVSGKFASSASMGTVPATHNGSPSSSTTSAEVPRPWLAIRLDLRDMLRSHSQPQRARVVAHYSASVVPVGVNRKGLRVLERQI